MIKNLIQDIFSENKSYLIIFRWFFSLLLEKKNKANIYWFKKCYLYNYTAQVP